jgi:hypothetical protein
VKVGDLLRHKRASGFKLALVVGRPAGIDDKLRVCIWRAESAKWTQPQLVRIDELVDLTEHDHRKRALVIARAIDVAIKFNLAGCARPEVTCKHSRISGSLLHSRVVCRDCGVVVSP